MVDCDEVQEFLNSGRGIVAAEAVLELYQASTPAGVMEVLRDASEEELKDIILQLLVVVDDLQERINDLCDAESNSF